MSSKKNSPAVSKETPGNTRPRKERIDVLLVERGLVPSRERAQAFVLAGQVRADGQRVDKPGSRTATNAHIELSGQPPRYASRAGFKLEGAIGDFGIAARGKVCLDVGSSTGGFTDCLLQNEAGKVYAVDVNIDQLNWKLRNDPRVVTVEKNARYLHPQDIDELAALVVMDVSFISVTKVLPAICPLATSGSDFLILIKPQFELEKRDVGKGGIVRDSTLHQRAIDRVVTCAVQFELDVVGVKPSRLPGSEGNQEFFLYARRCR